MGHHHHHAPSKLTWAFIIAISLNLGYTGFEAVYALIANSASLLADAGHNLGDVLSLAVAWVASWLARQGANKRFSYGFKKASIWAALFNAVVLIATSCAIFVEAIHKLYFPGPINAMIVVVVALIGIFVNGGTALLFHRQGENDLNIRSVFLHLASDALISLGVVITAVIIYFSGWLWADPMVSILIVIAILYATVGLLRKSINLALDGVPSEIEMDHVEAYLRDLPGVTDIHDLHIWALSTFENALTVHLIIPDGELSHQDLQSISNDLLKQFNIAHSTIQSERGSHPCPQHACIH